MICKKCGKMFADNGRFCPYCGQKAEEQVPVGAGTNIPPNPYYAGGISNSGYGNIGNGNSQGEKKKKHTAPIVIALVAVVAVLASGSIFLYIGRLQDDTATDGPARPPRKESVEADDSAGSSSADTGTADRESFNAVLAYVDRAEEVVSKAYSDIIAIEDNGRLDVTEQYRQEAGILGDSLSELSDLRQRAQAVGGTDAKFEKASKAYFDMVCDSQEAFYEMWVFMTDVLEFDDELLADRPDMEDYDLDYEFDVYYNDLYEWYQVAKDGYSAIDNCPSCLETKWKQYGDILDLNESIAYKLYYGDMFDEYYDWLRIYSGFYMLNRHDIVESKWVDELFACIDGEMDHFLMQKGVAAELADEMHSYAKLGEAERGRFEFEHIREGELSLSYDSVDIIYPSLYNTYDAFLIIKTGCVSGTRKIVVEAEIQGLTQKYKESFTLDPSYTEIYIKPPALTGNLQLASAKDAQITVTISEQNGTLIDAKSFPITVKSKYDVEWYTDEYGVATQDNILCFLTPESPAIAELKRLAIDEISDMTGGTVEAFAGYQNVTRWENYVYTYLQAVGIMRAMYEKGVRYNMDPYSLSGSNQHILLPEDVLSQKSGLCIETALVVASALQSANMHVFLVLPPGHAQVAVETWSGSGQYFLIETTSLSSTSNNRDIFIDIANQLIREGTMASSGQPIMFMTSDQWYDYLSVSGTYLIDCDDSRILGLTTFAN